MKRIKQAACTFSFLAITACGGMEGQDVQVDEPKQEIGQVAQLLKAKHPIPGQYIVVLKDDLKEVALAGAESIGQEMALKHGGKVFHTYRSALKGFAIRIPEARIQQLLMDPRVAYIEEDQPVQAIAIQNNATWGIDRVDQRNLPLNSQYDNKDVTASNVHSYIIDTGVRLTHSQFAGRMGNGFDAVTSGGSGNDCHGHGTHVAGTVGGTTHGLAKQTIIHPVRVLNCQGSGTNAGVIAGMDWVADNHIKPAVANMSLGGGASTAVDDAVTRMVNAGVVVAVAAGNDSGNACSYSPARAAAAITVGATTSSDARASYSNYGTCLDIFAPGSSITSAWSTSDTATNTISGTSMASPHVAGAAALYLSANPSATPQQVRDALVANGTSGVVGSPGSGSPNVLLYTAFITGGGGGGGDTQAPTTSITSPSSGSTVSGTITISANASDNVGVSFVDFYVGSTLIGTDSTAPYSISWNTNQVANGAHSLTTKAFDGANNVGTSSAVSVNVSNGGGGGCGSSQNLLLNPGFESGSASWTADTGVINNSATNAHSGSWKAWLNGYGYSTTDYVYQTITIPSSACSAQLSFWLKITSSETTSTKVYDKLTVTIRNSSNTVLATLATYSNLNEAGYTQKTFDLSAFKGQTVRVYFHGTEDWSAATSFFIDDTAVNITQ